MRNFLLLALVLIAGASSAQTHVATRDTLKSKHIHATTKVEPKSVKGVAIHPVKGTLSHPVKHDSSKHIAPQVKK